MGNRQKEGMKSGAQGRKKPGVTRSGRAGTKCQLGFVIYESRAAAEAASGTGRARRCGRCRHWHSQ